MDIIDEEDQKIAKRKSELLESLNKSSFMCYTEEVYLDC